MASYVLQHALRSFVSATIATAMSVQLIYIVNTMLVGHFVGGNGLAAMELVYPVTSVVYALTLLTGIGGGLMLARAMGKDDEEQVRRLFTLSLLLTLLIPGLLVALVLTFCREEVAVLLCGDSVLFQSVEKYLQVYAFATMPISLGIALQNYIETVGKPLFVTKMIAIYAVFNVLLSTLFLGCFHADIWGVALSTLLAGWILVIFASIYLFRHTAMLRPKQLDRQCLKLMRKIFISGAPLMLDELLFAVSLIFVNNIILQCKGVDGMVVWSICMRVLTLGDVLGDGVSMSLCTMGGTLFGEKNMKSFNTLFRMILHCLLWMVALAIILPLLFPQFTFSFFGINVDFYPEGPLATRLMLLSLFVYCVNHLFVNLANIQRYSLWAAAQSAIQCSMMVLSVWTMSKVSADNFWWWIPISLLLTLTIVLLGNTLMSFYNKSLRPFTAIPLPLNNTINAAFPYTSEGLSDAEDAVDDFFARQTATMGEGSEMVKKYIRAVYANKPQGTNATFDVFAHFHKDKMRVVIKDGAQAHDYSNDVDQDTVAVHYSNMYETNIIKLTIDKDR